MQLAVSLFILLAFGYLLVIGKQLFVPFVIAVFVWFLIKTIALSLMKYARIKPCVLAYSLACLSLVLFVAIPIQLVSSSVPDIARLLPKYEANIFAMLEGVLQRFSLDQGSIIAQIKSSFNISATLSAVANGLTQFTSNVLLVLVYIAFLFAEQKLIKNKLLSLAEHEEQKVKFESIIAHIDERIARYVWVKTQLSFLTAIFSYIAMVIIGIDFAAFWALLIFILNFIPNIGSIIATAFPILLAMVQFETLTPAIVALCILSVIQFIFGNWLEPKWLGKSLNLSPLVILIALFVWGSIWGVTGLFLSIPITVVLMIIFSEFKRTRPIAVLLSSDGHV